MAATFSLHELGTSKASVKRCFEANYDRPADDVWSNRIRALLAERRTRYTLGELNDLIEVFATPHHECVVENPEDFPAHIAALHARIEAKLERWRDLISQRECADASLSEPHAFAADPHDAARVRYGQEDIEHCAFCGQAEDRPIHREAV